MNTKTMTVSNNATSFIAKLEANRTSLVVTVYQGNVQIDTQSFTAGDQVIVTPPLGSWTFSSSQDGATWGTVFPFGVVKVLGQGTAVFNLDGSIGQAVWSRYVLAGAVAPVIPTPVVKPVTPPSPPTPPLPPVSPVAFASLQAQMTRVMAKLGMK
jgi:hypothetical protein